MKEIICFFIKTYQKAASPFLPRTCRFYPSCSSYALQAIERYGVLKGGVKLLSRIFRCHPFSKGGYDPLR
ncbi:MAG: membrane protein insertion efficiency factor YidD [Candidatus Omnitrophota bacterium]